MQSSVRSVALWLATNLAIGAQVPIAAAAVPSVAPAAPIGERVRESTTPALFFAWRAGDRQAGNALFARYRAHLQLALRRASGRDDVQDEVHDILAGCLADDHALLSSTRFEAALVAAVERHVARSA